MKNKNKGPKIIKVITCYPNMMGLGNYYACTLEDKNLSVSAKRFIQSEIKRMSLINQIVADILLNKRTKKPWMKDLEKYLLNQFIENKKIKSMTKEEVRSFLVSLMFPKE